MVLFQENGIMIAKPNRILKESSISVFSSLPRHMQVSKSNESFVSTSVRKETSSIYCINMNGGVIIFLDAMCLNSVIGLILSIL